MRKRKIRPPKVDMDLTDLNLTTYGGSSILAQTARQYGLFELLDDAVRVKVRNRGATDSETPWAIIACLARATVRCRTSTRCARTPSPARCSGCATFRRRAGLRAVQFTALPKRARMHGLRPVIRYVMRTHAAYMVRSARGLRVRFAKTNFRLDWLYEAMESLEPRAADRAGGLTDPRWFDAAPAEARLPASGGGKPVAGPVHSRSRRPRWRRRGAGSVSSGGNDRST